MDQMKNLIELFYDQVLKKGDAPFLWSKKESTWQSITWEEAAKRVASLADKLKTLGVTPGDRVGLVSESRPEWPIADLAIMAVGGITVPAYVTNSITDHKYILEDSQAIGVIVSSTNLAENVLPAAEKVASLKFAISFDQKLEVQTDRISLHSLDTIVNSCTDTAAILDNAVESISRDETACLIYTSGTGGTPKGVMLSHGAILCNCIGSNELLQEMGLGDEVFLSFLPLSHSYEHTAGQFFPIMIGAQIYYAEGIDLSLIHI